MQVASIFLCYVLRAFLKPREKTFSSSICKRSVEDNDGHVYIYEDGALKDQKLNKKLLISTPEFKQHLLQPCKCSFKQLPFKRRLKSPSRMNLCVFMRLKQLSIHWTNSQSWDDATQNISVEDSLTVLKLVCSTR